MSLTVIGTGHVFNIGDSVMFLVKHSWPDAVCVELDEMRYHALTGDREALRRDLEVRGIDPDADREERLKKAPPIYRSSAKYQERMSAENGVSAGADMAAAIAAGREAGAEIVCADVDAQEAMMRMWREMPAAEKMRYRLSGIGDRVFGRKKVEKTQEEYSKDQAAYIEGMRRKYPTLVRVLIDERNAHMAEVIKRTADTHERTVAVVGDGHVDGLVGLIGGDIRTVRLADLTDPQRLAAVKSSFWEGNGE